ncbi:MAG: hypothetical protein Q8S16_09320 [Polaromonas sp.]|nr:hypothetical protein [Polaromonas sp.]
MSTGKRFNTGREVSGAARCLALLALWLASCAHALEFDYLPGRPDGVARGMTLSGVVAPGDTEKLLGLMRRSPADAWSALGRVELNISGGDTREALLLADTLVGLYPHMVVAADCAGACAIVWLAGAWRVLPKGKIGIEKPPPFVPPAGAALATDAPPPYDPLPDQLRTYLIKQGVPPLLVEQVLASGAGSVYWLTEKDINTTGVWPPYYFEKLRTNCPLLLHNNEAFHALRRCAARLIVSQKAFALDRLLAGVNDPWWNENRDIFKNAPR